MEKELYVAKDGKEFSQKYDCLKHEKSLDATEALKSIKAKECDFQDYYSWYYCTSKDDFEIIVNYIRTVVQQEMGTVFSPFRITSQNPPYFNGEMNG